LYSKKKNYFFVILIFFIMIKVVQRFKKIIMTHIFVSRFFNDCLLNNIKRSTFNAIGKRTNGILTLHQGIWQVKSKSKSVSSQVQVESKSSKLQVQIKSVSRSNSCLSPRPAKLDSSPDLDSSPAELVASLLYMFD